MLNGSSFDVYKLDAAWISSADTAAASGGAGSSAHSEASDPQRTYVIVVTFNGAFDGFFRSAGPTLATDQ
jgi:hypothetical protein